MSDPNLKTALPQKQVDTKTVVGAYFDSHAMSEDQQNRSKKCREGFKILALTIIENTKKNADQTAALRKLREASMTLNSAIATEEILP